MGKKVFIHKIKNKFGKQLSLKEIKDNDIFKGLSEIEQIAWIHIVNCTLNLNMTIEQVLNNELLNFEMKNTIVNIYERYLKYEILNYKIKREMKTETIKIRVTHSEKQNIEIEAKAKELSISNFIRQILNLK